MKINKNTGRRSFLKTAGLALVAASVPTVILAQKKDEARPSSGNNLKQMLLGCHSAADSTMSGIWGQACFQFQMCADIGGTRGGFGTISDPVITGVNSHIKFEPGRLDINDIYVFQGTIQRSQSPELIGHTIIAKVQVLPDDNCNLSLTIGDTPVQGMLLPAIQKVREAAARSSS